MEIHPPLLFKQREAASRWEDCQDCVATCFSTRKSSYYVKAAVSYYSRSLPTLCVSCFFQSTISNSSRSLSSSKLCHQAGNGGSQNFLRVSVHALLNQWPSGQSEVLLLVMEPQIESLFEGNHRSGCKRKKCCRKQSKDIISASLNILPARFCEPLTPACHTNHIWDDAPTSRDESNNILPVLLLFFPPLLLTPQRGYKYNKHGASLRVWNGSSGLAAESLQRWGDGLHFLHFNSEELRSFAAFRQNSWCRSPRRNNLKLRGSVSFRRQRKQSRCARNHGNTSTSSPTGLTCCTQHKDWVVNKKQKNKRLWWQRTGTARQQKHFFSKAVMRIYHILTALLHFFFPSLRIIKRVFLINNKCSKQPGVQLREIR